MTWMYADGEAHAETEREYRRAKAEVRAATYAKGKHGPHDAGNPPCEPCHYLAAGYVDGFENGASGLLQREVTIEIKCLERLTWLICSLCSGESPLVREKGNPDVPKPPGDDYYHEVEGGARFLCSAWIVQRELERLRGTR